MSQSRREFLQASAGVLPLATLLPAGCASGASERRAKPKLPFGISLAEWSLHRALHSGVITNLDFPKVAAERFGIHAVEYVNSFFKDSARNASYLADLNRRCADHGVTNHLIMCDGEGALAAADASERTRAVENHKAWVDAARTLGCRSIRVNVQGDGTPAEHQAQAARGLVALAEYAAPLDIDVIVENHGGYSSDGGWLAGVMKLAAHPRVGTLPDFGNFDMGGGRIYDRYRGIEELMPFAKAVSAKSYDFDAAGNETVIDYARMLKIVHDSGFRSWIGVEYEGERMSETEGILATKALLERLRPTLT